MPKESNAPGDRAATDHAMAQERSLADDDLRRLLEEGGNGSSDRQVRRSRADSLRREDRASTDAASAGLADRERALSEERSREDVALDRERIVADEELEHRHDELALALRRLLRSERDANDLRMRDERATSDAHLAVRDEFLAMVCHDLRSLLAAIGMRASLMSRDRQRERPAGATVRDDDAIQGVVRRMNSLLGDLLDVVAMESGRFAVVPIAHPAASMLSDAARGQAPSAAARQITIHRVPSAGECWGYLDVNRIQQVLWNLIGNAVKFTPEGGAVTVAVTEGAREVVFEVSDTGPGIPAGKEHAVFERFSQLTPDTHVGLGLGLFICKNIVEAHGGRIWVERRKAGGSRFLFTVPAADPAARPMPAA